MSDHYKIQIQDDFSNLIHLTFPKVNEMQIANVNKQMALAGLPDKFK